MVSDALGWNIVPETVWRSGPFGPGMVQRWIDVDEHVDLVGLVRGTDPLLERISVFDVVINNADRKGGHLLPTDRWCDLRHRPRSDVCRRRQAANSPVAVGGRADPRCPSG